MFEGCDIQLNTDFFDDKEKWLGIADKIVYTGTIDKYFDYEFGELEYRSLRSSQVLQEMISHVFHISPNADLH